MDSRTILTPVAIEVRRLRMGVIEAFLLSQVDGRLDLEGLAEVTGLDSRDVLRIAERLLELGAVSTAAAARQAMSRNAGRPAGRIDPRMERSSVRPEPRPDPRAEKASLRPVPRADTASLRPSPRGERTALRATPTALRSESRATPAADQPAPARSRKSLHMGRVGPSPRAAAEPEGAAACELDDATVAAISALAAKVETADHYAVLEIERDADKKAIKRAYFGFASKFHPDRFFGKKLGACRAQVDRAFRRLTEAHDTLTNPKLRTEYDATLGPAPKRASAASAPARPSRKMSKAPSRRMKAASRQMKSSSRSMKAATAATPQPPPAPAPAPAPASEAPSAPAAPPPVSARSPVSDDKERTLRAAALQLQIQARVDLLVAAAEAALASNDLLGAANNYRLALVHREDPRLRMIFEDVDARVRALRFEKNIAPARVAEREQRWADAATFLTRAHEAKADCDVAARAANALRLSGGDIERAISLAEQAIALAPRNAAYRITLAEVYLAARRPDEAESECATARSLAPKDEELKARAAELTKQAKAKSG